MSHNHPIYDVDKRFVIDPVSRAVAMPEGQRPVLIQYDHNSEHITFECDRFIEGHDLMLCDIVEVHYNNIGDSRHVSNGVYPVEDLQVSSADDSKIIFTWVVSQMATVYTGKLAFVVAFTCTDEGDILYRWNTRVNDDLEILSGISNSEAVADTYADVLEGWRMELFGIGDTAEAEMIAFVEDQQKAFNSAIEAKGRETYDSIPKNYTDLHANVDDLNGLLAVACRTPNLYNVIEFDENGYYFHSDGRYTNEIPEYGSSGFIAVKEGIQYYQNSGAYTTFWDANKNFIGGQERGKSFIPPTGCKYVNCSLLKSLKYGFVLVEYGDVNYKYLYSENDPIHDYFSFETNNLYDPRFVVEGFYDLSGNYSYMDAYGSFTIAVTGGETYIKSLSGYVAYFDESNVWIKTDTIAKNTNFVVPNNAVKMNVAVLMTEPDFWLVPSGETVYRKLVSDYIPTTIGGLKYGALGDSITYGYDANTCYGDILSSSEKLSFVNYGISGNRIADCDDHDSEPMYIRYTEMNDDLDIVTVFGGTNDYASQTPIGENSDMTGETFKGALNILCKGLQTKYLGKRLGFITPIHRRSENAGTNLVEYVNAVKEICALYAIPVLDLYNTSTISCVSDENSNGLLIDGLHPSDAGHAVLARKIANFIKTL